PSMIGAPPFRGSTSSIPLPKGPPPPQATPSSGGGTWIRPPSHIPTQNIRYSLVKLQRTSVREEVKESPKEKETAPPAPVQSVQSAPPVSVSAPNPPPLPPKPSMPRKSSVPIPPPPMIPMPRQPLLSTPPSGPASGPPMGVGPPRKPPPLPDHRDRSGPSNRILKFFKLPTNPNGNGAPAAALAEAEPPDELAAASNCEDDVAD
ncbi:hypothetical protein ANCDUO_20302, partial [Ancylostoma duodenale]